MIRKVIILIWVAVNFVPSITEENENSSFEKVLFHNPDEFELSLRVIDLQTQNVSHIDLIFNRKILVEFNLTMEQAKKGHVEVAPNGDQDFVVEGRRLSLGITTSTILNLNPNSSTSMQLNLDRFKNMKMKDIEDDPSLVPLPPMLLKWPKIKKCKLENLGVLIKALSVVLEVNDILVTNLTLKNISMYKKTTHLLNEGILLTVLNPHSCKKTFESVMLTADFGGYRDLAWILNSVSPHRMVILASLSDGAAFLPISTKKQVEKLGSHWVTNYLHKDSWLSIFTKGGKMFHEVLVTNQGLSNTSMGSPIHSHLKLNLGKFRHGDLTGCVAWPKMRRWKARAVFCESFDGFSDLCSCEKPFDIPNQRNLLQKGVSLGKIPIIIVAGKRTRHLFHLFQTIAHQKSVFRENFLIITDDYHKEVSHLAFILDVKILVHKPEGENATRISRTFRFSLFNALKVFPEAEAFIVLEDDLIVAPDFYSYMNQLFPLFEMDSSIFCVNAFSHLSSPFTTADPTRVYRVTTYPAYGWMMSRKIVSQILPRWLPINVVHDWDFFIGSDLVSDDRECIIPDINRSYHWATMGFHVKPSYFAEKYYLSRTMTTDPDIKLQPLERLIKDNYEKEYLELLGKAIPLDEDKLSNIHQAISPGGIYSIFFEMKDKADPKSLRLAGDLLDVWNRDIRDVHNSSWRLHYRNATVFVIGVPASPYRKFRPKGFPFIQGDEISEMEIDFAEFYSRSFIKFKTHKNNNNVPEI